MVEPMYEKFIEPSKKHSDLIIDANNINFKKIIEKLMKSFNSFIKIRSNKYVKHYEIFT